MYACACSGESGTGANRSDYRTTGFEIIPQPDGRYGLKTDGSPQDNNAALRARPADRNTGRTLDAHVSIAGGNRERRAGQTSLA